MNHTYTCGICNYTTKRPGELESHTLEKHPQAPTAGLAPPMLRDGKLATPTDLLADHIKSLLDG